MDEARKDIEDYEDQALMSKIAKGDEGALRALMVKHGGSLMRYSGHVLNDFDQAEDVVQFTFMQVWQNASTWRPDALVKTWMYTIAHRGCLNIMRGRKGVMVDIDDVALAAQDGRGPEEAMHNAQARDVLNMAMADLPERQRSALLLRYAEEHSQKEAAAILGVSEKAFESLLSRAKAKMSGILEKVKGTI